MRIVARRTPIGNGRRAGPFHDIFRYRYAIYRLFGGTRVWKSAPMTTELSSRTRSEWEAQARKLRLDGRAIINGQRRTAISERTFDAISPVDGRILAAVARCDAADVDA